jgi:ion channel-forming bestrophin family protein
LNPRPEKGLPELSVSTKKRPSVVQTSLAGVRDFWSEALSIRGTASGQVFLNVALLSLFSLAVYEIDLLTPDSIDLRSALAPYEVAGAALSLMLVLRTNAGYERWWEGRKLWGGITNQSRALAVIATTADRCQAEWRDQVVRWTIAFGWVTRGSLRGDRETPEISALLGPEASNWLAGARHMPSAVLGRIAVLLREGYENETLNLINYKSAEEARNLLMDHVGGCERILKSPLPKVYSVNIRRFILLFLTTLPFAMLHKVGWLAPLAQFLVAFPILALDRIGVELQNPFSLSNVGHLPLDEICAAIEADLLAVAADPGFRPDLGRDSLRQTES